MKHLRSGKWSPAWCPTMRSTPLGYSSPGSRQEAREASVADITLMFAQDWRTPSRGAARSGAALSAGHQIYCVSPHHWSFRHYPRVRNFNTLEQAVTAIVAAT